MSEPVSQWRNTTHDWASSVDVRHLAEVRAAPAVFAPGGALHLVFEVLAYAADEAQGSGSLHCTVALHRDGSISVADDGRGTDTRVDDQGRSIKKPVMATKDLRFFDHPMAEALPDEHPRRGLSVVAALSEWLIHTNRRTNGAWQQRYEYGLPVTGLEVLEPNGATGTTVQFRPGSNIGNLTDHDIARLAVLARGPCVAVVVVDQR